MVGFQVASVHSIAELSPIFYTGPPPSPWSPAVIGFGSSFTTLAGEFFLRGTGLVVYLFLVRPNVRATTLGFGLMLPILAT